MEDNGEIIIEEINEATVGFEFSSSNYSRNSYKIDIVQMERLKDYLERCKKRNEHIYNTIKKFPIKNTSKAS